MITGSFQRTFQSIDSHNQDLVTKRFHYLSQDDLTDGWEIVLPLQNRRVKKDSDGKDLLDKNERKVYQNYVFTNELTLAQLPEYLWKYVKNGVVYHNFYKFVIKETPFDKEIRQLNELMKKLPEVDFFQVHELVSGLEKNGVDGWLIKRAKKFINDYKYFDCKLYDLSSGQFTILEKQTEAYQDFLRKK